MVLHFLKFIFFFSFSRVEKSNFEIKKFFFVSHSSTSRSQVIYVAALLHPISSSSSVTAAESQSSWIAKLRPISSAVKSTQTLPLCRAIHFISLVLVVVVMFEIRRSGRVSIHLPCPLQLISLDKNSLFLKSEFEKHFINDKTMIMKCNL